MTYVELDHLEKTFGHHRALRGVDLSIEEGEFVSLLGPSGCGKTTTLRIVAGFEEPDRGDVRIGGSSVLGRRADKRGVGIVFQSYALFPHMTVLDNIAYGLRAQGTKGEAATKRAHEMLELVELHGVSRRRAHELSGGQQQRVALARALAVRPRVLALDEPLGALDKKLREQMQLALTELHRELGMTMIYVTHDQEEALSMSSRVAVMSAGEIRQYDTPSELYHHPNSLYVFEFVGRSSVLHGRIDEVSSGRATTDLGVSGVARAAMPRGSRCVVCVRPERIAIHTTPPATNGQNLVPGVIHDTIFNGQTTHYIVQLTGDSSNAARRVEVSVLSKLDLHASIGTEVILSFSPDDTFVFPNEAGADDAGNPNGGAEPDAIGASAPVDPEQASVPEALKTGRAL